MKKLIFTVAGGIFAYGTYGKYRYQQSARSFLLEKGMRAIGYKDRIRVTDPEYFMESFELPPSEDKFPAGLLRGVSWREMWVGQMQVFSWNEIGEKTQKVVVYLHGGGYVSRASKLHYLMVNRVVKATGARAIFPTYGLGPQYNISTELLKLVTLYRELVAEHGAKQIVLMGDSAGGGLVMSLLQGVKAAGLEMPAQAILLSPWVNAAMDHPQAPFYDTVEPMIPLAGLLRAAKCWAAPGMALNDPLISPIYLSDAELEGFPRITSFVGLHEIFYPDIRDFHKRLNEAGIENRLIVAPRMIHVYPVFPTPEGREAVQQIITLVEEK
ncbi:hydrolase, alpha/beta domain protein [Gleimia coleocanis DSM 15436]|uniref:Hydrolase, alpha/beta domain protein n=1 Tax=Gleimia coleocanis DSM 15436 TaxID=525245 RepID=C0W023_9ACTO|nr:alpha/beta hydrolase [Gleimia coleocanis]EEH63882.1 hydrolase, alpha/beta domain protein [Gleimia coleocanis DSM 15436]